VGNCKVAGIKFATCSNCYKVQVHQSGVTVTNSHTPDSTVVSSAPDHLMPELYMELLLQTPGQGNEWSDRESAHLLSRWEPEPVLSVASETARLAACWPAELQHFALKQNNTRNLM